MCLTFAKIYFLFRNRALYGHRILPLLHFFSQIRRLRVNKIRHGMFYLQANFTEKKAQI